MEVPNYSTSKQFQKLEKIMGYSFEFMYKAFLCYYNLDAASPHDIGWTNEIDLAYFDTIPELITHMDRRYRDRKTTY